METVYNALFGKYIGKIVSIFDEGYCIGGDCIVSRYFSGVLTRVKIERNKLVFVLDGNETTVNLNSKIKIITEQ